MIKTCGDTITLPLNLFPDDCKKSNVVPIHKKESKNLIKTIDL